MVRRCTPRQNPRVNPRVNLRVAARVWPACGPDGVIRPFVVRLPALRVGGSAGRLRCGSSSAGGGSIPDERAHRAAPTSEPGGAGRHSGASGRGEGRGVRRRSSTRATSDGRGGRGRAARPRLRPCGGARAPVRQDLVDHRRLRDARHDPHRAGAVRARERVDLEDLPQQRRPSASGLGGRELRRDHHRHGGIGGGGRRPAAHAARAVGVPPVVPRGHLPLVGDVGQHPREKL